MDRRSFLKALGAGVAVIGSITKIKGDDKPNCCDKGNHNCPICHKEIEKVPKAIVDWQTKQVKGETWTDENGYSDWVQAKWGVQAKWASNDTDAIDNTAYLVPLVANDSTVLYWGVPVYTDV
jgi:hypothetical protein